MKLLLLLTTIVFASLAYSQSGPAPQPQASAATDASMYRFVPGDVVAVKFFFNPELNEEVQIRPDGFISLLLAGEYRIAGKTVAEATQEIGSLYAKEIKTPRLSIQIKTYAAQKIYVTGEVQRPGMLAMPGETTVIAALNETGGIKHTGDLSRVVLLRRGDDGKPVSRTLAIGSPKKPGPDAGLLLKPFDVLVVPETRIARADRFVDQYIRQLSPAMLNFGFNYLFQNNPAVITF
jgi:polysaccharide biosynthesis/export protein